MRLIDADKAAETLERIAVYQRRIGQNMYADELETDARILRNPHIYPTEYGAPVVHARWVKSDIPHEKYCCSACGCACWYYDFGGEVARSRYCPTCGAKMDGGAGDV